jgi:cupin 2 domain-containing protein
MLNLFDRIPAQLPQELIETLHQAPGIRIERIVSRQHASPPGFWYDQEIDEWVLLLSGSAGLRIEGQEAIVKMKPGHALLLPAHQRHRVEWTDSAVDTIWLAIHFKPGE